MGKIKELHAMEVTVGATPTSIKNFIDNTITDKKLLNRITYVEICAYDKDGDTARGAIDLVHKPNVTNEYKYPILAGQAKVFDDVGIEALNNWYLERAAASDVDTTIIVGIE